MDLEIKKDLASNWFKTLQDAFCDNVCKLERNKYQFKSKTWRRNFISSWSDISKQGFDHSFKKIWDFYFSYCEAGFKAKNIDLIQFSICNK